MLNLSKVIHIFFNLLLPENCFGCGRPDTYLCQNCRRQLPYPEIQGNHIWAAASYRSEILKKAIHALKYKRAQKIAKPLAKLIFERLPQNYGSPASIILIPIPLTKKRLRQRGFNQAKLIAKHLSDKTSIPLLINVLYKAKDTSSQVEIKNREKRLKNLKGSFAVKNTELIKNKNIWLIDDVTTTGATINEARKVLLAAGARTVTGIVVARG